MYCVLPVGSPECELYELQYKNSWCAVYIRQLLFKWRSDSILIYIYRAHFNWSELDMSNCGLSMSHFLLVKVMRRKNEKNGWEQYTQHLHGYRILCWDKTMTVGLWGHWRLSCRCSAIYADVKSLIIFMRIFVIIFFFYWSVCMPLVVRNAIVFWHESVLT